MRLLDLATVLRDAGLTVAVQAGWETRGQHLTAVNGIMWHHTATPATNSDSSTIRVLRDGRSDLPGPLCQLGLARDGTWHVIAAGRANHAGRGSWPGLAGNDDVIGIECFHAGTSAERWTDRQLDALEAGTAALCAAYDVPPDAVIGHKEWAPSRKVDPYGLDMNVYRTAIRDRLTQTVAAPPEDTDMPLTDADIPIIRKALLGAPLPLTDDVQVGVAIDRIYRWVDAIRKMSVELVGRDADLDDEAVAAAIAAHLDDDLARAVLDALTARLAS